MLSQKYRFHGHGSLRYHYRNGHVVRTKHFMLRITVNKQRTDSRAAVIVSKKIFKAAVRRNRIRRRVYESVRSLWPRLNGTYDLSVTVFSKEVLVLPYDELHAELTRAFEEAQLLA